MGTYSQLSQTAAEATHTEDAISLQYMDSYDNHAQKTFSIEELVPKDPGKLPDFDKAISTRNACIGGLVLSYVAALASVLASVIVHINPEKRAPVGWKDFFPATPYWGRAIQFPDSYSRELAAFAISALVTLCSEAMGYIHGISLRWAMHQSGRLKYCSNLRLFCNESTSRPNAWYINLLSSLALITSYAGASTAISGPVDHTPGSKLPALVNGPSLLFLGLGLLLQAAICTWCLTVRQSAIVTWSSNVLTVTIACLHDSNRLSHRSGRCLHPAKFAQQETDTTASRPTAVQASMRATDTKTDRILLLVFAFLPLYITWAIASYLENLGDGNEMVIAMPEMSGKNAMMVAFLIVAAVQSVVTLGLHTVELPVNRARDEACWRHAAIKANNDPRHSLSQEPGARKTYNSITSALTSWQSLFLYAMKPISHWLFGSALRVYPVRLSPVVVFVPKYIIGICVCALASFVFVLYLLCHRPKGPMPSAWGHIQTLADLVDDWGDGHDDRLHWGDKGVNEDGTRHAGTSTKQSDLGKIDMDALYS